MGSNYRMIKFIYIIFVSLRPLGLLTKNIVHDYHYNFIHHSGLCIQSHQTDQDQAALTGLVVAAVAAAAAAAVASAVVVEGSESLSWARFELGLLPW